MGPIFNFAAYWSSLATEAAVGEPDDGAVTLAEALADGGRRSFETHPDIQQLVVQLQAWYLD